MLLPDPQTIFPRFNTVTPYSSHCNKNYAASGDEFDVIREIISEQEAQLEEFEVVFEDANNVYRRLCEMQDQLKSSIRRHKGLLSCVRRLPTELLKTIFVLCLPQETYNPPSRYNAPLLLMAVCGRWRAVALDTSTLWRSLSIRWSPSRLRPQDVIFYDHWLSRAGQSPLPLELAPPYRDFWMGPVSDDVVIQLLQPYSSQFKRLHLRFGCAAGLDVLFKDMSMVEYLVLTGDMNTMRSAQSMAIVQSQPRLRTLILDSPPFSVDILSIFQPGWANLTHIVVREHGRGSTIDHTVFQTLLQLCSNLEHIAFCPVSVKHDQPFSITHPNLRSLSIGMLRESGSLWDTFTLPNLRYLSIYYSSSNDLEEELEEFMRYFSRQKLVFDGETKTPDSGLGLSIARKPQSRFTLSSAALINPIVRHELDIWRASILSVFSPEWTSLTHLRVMMYDYDNLFWKFLQLCPNLEDLTFRRLCPNRSGLWEPTPPPTSLTHPILRALDVDIENGTVGDLLDTLTLPGLSRLVMMARSSGNFEDFRAFFSRSSCPLETLNIRGEKVLISESERGQFVEMMPTLNDVHLCVRETLEKPTTTYTWTR